MTMHNRQKGQVQGINHYKNLDKTPIQAEDGSISALVIDIKKHCLQVWIYSLGPYDGIEFTRSLDTMNSGEHQKICQGLDDLGYLYKVNVKGRAELIHYEVIFKTSPDILELEDGLTEHATLKEVQFGHNPFEDIERVGVHEYILTYNFKPIPGKTSKGVVLSEQKYRYDDPKLVMTDADWIEELSNIKDIMQFE